MIGKNWKDTTPGSKGCWHRVILLFIRGREERQIAGTRKKMGMGGGGGGLLQ